MHYFNKNRIWVLGYTYRRYRLSGIAVSTYFFFKFYPSLHKCCENKYSTELLKTENINKQKIIIRKTS